MRWLALRLFCGFDEGADVSVGMRIVIRQQHILENKVCLPDCRNYIRRLWNALYSAFIYLILFFIFLMQGQKGRRIEHGVA